VKKLIIALFNSLFIAVIFSACNDDLILAPQVVTTIDTTNTSSINVLKGTVVPFHFTVHAPGKIEWMRLYAIANKDTVAYDVTGEFKGDTAAVYSNSYLANAVKTVFILDVMAQDNQEVMSSITITADTIGMYTYSKTLYMPDTAYSSYTFFTATDGSTYSYKNINKQPKSYSKIVDFGYYYDDVAAKHSIFALSENPVADYDMSNWIVKPTVLTRFSDVDFTQIKKGKDVVSACSNLGSLHKIDNLKVDDVIGFQNVATGAYAVLKITAISADTVKVKRYISFTAKVQRIK
jgi:hypothetical protein